ncbi:transcription factor FER-LIKE IRON DEFICIENCY-INDUCED TRANSCRIPTION FACTOR-like [Lotus japonicus]|uniref:Putative basic helix-loop-helix protein BHLH20 n=1 Tax=Lotus japonicus TaxID=34305 RepID=C0JP23_LOTJA|nr:transcription factor FER-LIKE IRON DEFICIENCY-INDUCED TRANSCRIPTION FACTOR-like [Lotus japonicus]ACN21642.1 putative basic helix-loop-helix protein BHLH20 [Lotus japonicus]
MVTMDFHQQNQNLAHVNDFELHSFVEDPNFDQFINMIRGENEAAAICDFNSDILNGYYVDNTFHSFPANQFDQCNSNNSVRVYDPSSTLSSLSCFDEEAKWGGEEENDGEDSSSAGTTSTMETKIVNGKSRPKTDRSKTLISERRRRGRMKEKLYALRALVPNITKMDKASIIGDAVSYVYDLQAQAKKLKTEVAGLEASLLVSQNYQATIESPMKVQSTDHSSSICKRITQMDIFQVDETELYVKIVCNKGEGVAASLYKSLESLTGFHVQNSNLNTVSECFLLKFSLNVKGSKPEINLPNLKLWVTSAFLNQGFEFIPSFQA